MERNLHVRSIIEEVKEMQDGCSRYPDVLKTVTMFPIKE
jgi:hypothetical protein